jgi:hypothetical protein
MEVQEWRGSNIGYNKEIPVVLIGGTKVFLEENK